MGLILTTSGWTGAACTFQHASGSATYSVAADANNAYDVAQDLRTWLDDSHRPWAAAITSVTLSVDNDGKRHRFAFSYSGPGPLTFVSITPTAAWSSRFGDTSTVPPGTAKGTLAYDIGSLNWVKWDNVAGARCRAGSWRHEAPFFLPKRPVVEDTLEPIDAHILAEGLRFAAQPRTAYLYDEQSGAWRWVVIGEVTMKHPEDDRTVVGVELQVLGANRVE